MEVFSSLSQIQSSLISGDINLPDLVDYYLKRIEDRKELNAFVEVFSEEAKAAAISVSKKISDGNPGKLAGMVIGIKDNICYSGHKVSACSKILENYVLDRSRIVLSCKIPIY